MKLFLALFLAFVIFLLLRAVLRGSKGGNRSEAKEIPFKIAITTEHRNEGSQSTESDPDRDSWEGAFWDVQSPRNIEANLRIEYRDGNGSLTKRDIRLMKYGPWEGGAILWAYCHLRQANRTFRTDRILTCVDLDAGEVIENLETWLDAKYQDSPDRAIEEVIETAWDAVRVLFYVSKADGRLTKQERGVLMDAIRSMSDHPAIDDKRIDDLIQSLDLPSVTAFKQAFGRLVKQNRPLAEKVVTWADSMVATEKTVAAAEQEALDYLRSRLARA
jgi:predicted DNA-binding transcriptional regulator YafY